MVEQITVRYRDRLSGIVSCYDRIVITGTIPWACYAAGMTSFLHMHQIRIFDYARFAEPLLPGVGQNWRPMVGQNSKPIDTPDLVVV